MEFSVALTNIWQFVSRTNKYIDETQPWVLAKDENRIQELASVMAHLAESLRQVGILLKPFLTQTPVKIFSQLGLSDESILSWNSLNEFGAIKEGIRVQKGEPIFPRLETEVEVAYIKEQMQGTVKPVEEEKVEDSTPEITIDDFFKVQLKVAEVKEASAVKGAKKLLKLQLDLGNESRQVISGIAEYYQPEDLIGRKVICVTNLKPAKLRGELSEGMILAGSIEGKLSLATIDQSLPNGTIIK
jgi:methionyl-tRNA synthetase